MTNCYCVRLLCAGIAIETVLLFEYTVGHCVESLSKICVTLSPYSITFQRMFIKVRDLDLYIYPPPLDMIYNYLALACLMIVSLNFILLFFYLDVSVIWTSE